jgi:hydroxyethylthiazole kinase-like uncharacterized protein yjeF
VNPNVILTAAEMRAAEERVIAAGTPVETLMARAGAAAAETVARFAGPMPTLVLCGPGNNGGDGYVIARDLRGRGWDVRVAALGEPTGVAARWARGGWDGPVETLEGTKPAGLLIDALFGTGLTRPLAGGAAEMLSRLAQSAQVRIAIDLPSGAATDDGRLLSLVSDYELTVAFGALKPSHLLQPSARHIGRIVVADIGVPAESRLHRLAGPDLRRPGPDDHKYSRGYVAVIAGEMPGAAALTAGAAARSGAGYVRLVAPSPIAGLPHSIVQGSSDIETVLADERVGAVVLGPGLGRSDAGRALVRKVLASDRPLVLDADALVLLAEQDPASLIRAGRPLVLTPHAGEFERMFGGGQGSKVEAARNAAARTGAVLIYKGADTVIAGPDGRAAIAAAAPAWLASAGTGDVLAGIVAARVAAGMPAFEAACAAVWLHGEAGRAAGPALIADDLIDHLGPAVARCS